MQIAVVAFNRFDYFSKAIEALMGAGGCERWSVLVYVDSVLGTAKEQSSQSIEGNAAILRMCARLEQDHPFANFEYRLAEQNLGCWANKKACVAAAFDRSDDVLVIEDDIVISRDALEFCEWMKKRGVMDKEGVFQLSLFSYFFPHGLEAEEDLKDICENGLARSFYVRNWATPWGWFLPRRSWNLIKDDWNGWDQWVGHRVRELGKVEIAPLVSHCNNVGVVGINRTGQEGLDKQLRSVTSDDLDSGASWGAGGLSMDAFCESLGADLKLAREVSDRLHVRYKRCHNDYAHESMAMPKAAPFVVPQTPSMDKDGLALFERRLGDAKVYLEYGAGGSTLFAARIGVPLVLSVESDQSFLAGVWDAFLLSASPSRLITCHADIGATKEWGYPVDSSSKGSWPVYPGQVWSRIASEGISPDLILIDGRFRVACFCASILASEPGTRILFDDFVGRAHYQVAAEMVSPASVYGRMAEFVVPRDFDRAAVLGLLLRSTGDPR